MMRSASTGGCGQIWRGGRSPVSTQQQLVPWPPLPTAIRIGKWPEICRPGQQTRFILFWIFDAPVALHAVHSSEFACLLNGGRHANSLGCRCGATV
jgi:hypothetical protein